MVQWHLVPFYVHQHFDLLGMPASKAHSLAALVAAFCVMAAFLPAIQATTMNLHQDVLSSTADNYKALFQLHLQN